jgi:hypothetical protein
VESLADGQVLQAISKTTLTMSLRPGMFIVNEGSPVMTEVVTPDVPVANGAWSRDRTCHSAFSVTGESPIVRGPASSDPSILQWDTIATVDISRHRYTVQP